MLSTGELPDSGGGEGAASNLAQTPCNSLISAPNSWIFRRIIIFATLTASSWGVIGIRGTSVQSVFCPVLLLCTLFLDHSAALARFSGLMVLPECPEPVRKGKTGQRGDVQFSGSSSKPRQSRHSLTMAVNGVNLIVSTSIFFPCRILIVCSIAMITFAR